MDPSHLLLFGAYLLTTIVIETPILLIGLSPRHPLSRRLFAGLWLNACSYPIVFLVLPQIFYDRFWYLLVAEIFAPVAECLLFWLAFLQGTVAKDRKDFLRDMAVIVVANLASFGFGEANRLYWDLPWLRPPEAHQEVGVSVRREGHAQEAETADGGRWGEGGPPCVL